MYEALKELFKDEIQEAKQRAMEEAAQKARDEVMIKSIKSLMQSFSVDAKGAMEMLDLSEVDQSRYMTML